MNGSHCLDLFPNNLSGEFAATSLKQSLPLLQLFQLQLIANGHR